MFKTLCLKIFWILMGICGVITAVLCVWVICIDIKVTVKKGTEGPDRISNGHAPKIGLAAGALIVGTSIAACILNNAKNKLTLAVNILAGLALTAACLAIAVMDHIETEDQLDSKPPYLHDAYRRLLNRLKIIAAFSALDVLVEVVGFIIVVSARKPTSVNAMEMNKRF